MSGVITQRDGLSVFASDTAHRAEDQNLVPQKLLRIPAHPSALSQPEQVAARGFSEKFVGQW